MIDAVIFENVTFDAWAAALWRASWQAGLAALMAWFVCWLWPTMPARFQAWCWRLVCLKFVVALLWMTPVSLPLLPADNSAAKVTAISETAAAVNLPAVEVLAEQPVSSGSPWRLLFAVWLLVAGWQTARLVLAWRAAQQLCRSGVSCSDPNLLAQLAEARRAIGRWFSPQLLHIDGVGSPLLVGILRPTLIIPRTTLSRLDHSERGLVLAHELAHAAHRDLAWEFLAAGVRALFWFHPLAWLCEQQLRLKQEMAADELASNLQRLPPMDYAARLVSIVSKLGSDRELPALCAGVSGSQKSLEQRLIAMRFLKPRSMFTVLGYACLFMLVACVGITRWEIVQGAALAEEKPAAKVTPQVFKSGGGRGKFVAFQEGALTLQTNDGTLLKNQLPSATQVLVWQDGEGFKPVATPDTLEKVKAGAWVHIIVDQEKATIRIGARKAQTVGSFVSFNDKRLLILGKSLGESYVKKYGNQVHFNKFRDDVQAFESVDGGDYQLLGQANKVLANVKEGTVITIHGEGDDNITLVQIGVPAKK